jgi:hypothetical protein
MRVVESTEQNSLSTFSQELKKNWILCSFAEAKSLFVPIICLLLFVAEFSSIFLQVMGKTNKANPSFLTIDLYKPSFSPDK